MGDTLVICKKTYYINSQSIQSDTRKVWYNCILNLIKHCEVCFQCIRSSVYTGYCINTIKRYVYNNDASIIDNRYSLRKYLVLNKQTISQKTLMICYTAMYVYLKR